TRSPAERTVEMAKHIGIVGCSAEGAALCYRTICAEAPQYMAEHEHPEITMHTFPLSEYMAHIRKDQWREVAWLMLASARKLAQVRARVSMALGAHVSGGGWGGCPSRFCSSRRSRDPVFDGGTGLSRGARTI